MDAVRDYIWAVAHHWIYLMGSGPWLLDRLNKWFQFDLTEWIARKLPWITRFERRRIISAISISGIVIAGFLAFSDERSLYIQQTHNLDLALNKKERAYRAMTPEQETKLLDGLRRLVPSSSTIQIAFVDNPSSAKLAERFLKILKKLNITVTYAPAVADEIDEHGLYIYIRNPDRLTEETRSYLELFRDSGFDVQKADLQQIETFPPNIPFTIYVSYPPL